MGPQIPDWLRIQKATTRLPSTVHLDPGEAEAISLAKEIHADAVLLDERKGRAIALSEGLVVVRTLALLELAAERELIQLRDTFAKLQNTSFRFDPALIVAALDRDAKRKRPTGDS